MILDNNMTHLLKNDSFIKNKSKNVCRRRGIILSQRLQILHAVLSILKTKNLVFQKMHNMVYILILKKTKNMVKKVQAYRKMGYRALMADSATDVFPFSWKFSNNAFLKNPENVAFSLFKSA